MQLSKQPSVTAQFCDSKHFVIVSRSNKLKELKNRFAFTIILSGTLLFRTDRQTVRTFIRKYILNQVN